MQIVPAASAQEIDAIRGLFREYAASLPIKLDYQGFAVELASLPGKYASPGGRLLLAIDAGAVVGCAALRPFEGEVCEMKRLYVRPGCQGRGLGRALARRVVDEARAAGYRRMVLDTLASMRGAIGLYESLGFVRRPAYYPTPIADTVFMELALAR